MKNYLKDLKEILKNAFKSYPSIEDILEEKYNHLTHVMACSKTDLQYFVGKLAILMDVFYYSQFNIDDDATVIDLMKLSDEELNKNFGFDTFLMTLLQDKRINERIYRLYKNSMDIQSQIITILEYEMINIGGKTVGPERALITCRILPNTQPSIPMSYLSYNDIEGGKNGMYDERFIDALDLYKRLPNPTLSVYWRPQYFNHVKNAKSEMYPLYEVDSYIESYKKSNESKKQRTEYTKM